MTSRFRFVGVGRGCVRDNARGDTARCSVRGIARHWEVDSRQTARCSGATGCSRRPVRRGEHSRAQFAIVAAQFRATGVVDLDVLLDASASLSRRRAYDLVVTDTLFPFVPSLLAWGHDEATIRSFLARLRTALQPANSSPRLPDANEARFMRSAADSSAPSGTQRQEAVARVTGGRTRRVLPPGLSALSRAASGGS